MCDFLLMLLLLQAARSKRIGEIALQMDAICVDVGENGDLYTAHENFSTATIGLLEVRLKELQDLRASRQVLVAQKLTAINELWEKLSVHEHQRNTILTKMGLSRSTLDLLDQEHKRLVELKAANLKKLIASAQAEIENLWNDLCVTDVDRLIHSQAFADVYTEESLTARESLLESLRKRLRLARPIVEKIQLRESWTGKKAELKETISTAVTKKASSRTLQAALSEQRMIESGLPALEGQLLNLLEEWLVVHGEPFFYNGQDILAVLRPELEGSQPTKTTRTTVGVTPRKALPLAPTSSSSSSSATPSRKLPNPARTPSKPTRGGSSSSSSTATPARGVGASSSSSSTTTPARNNASSSTTTPARTSRVVPSLAAPPQTPTTEIRHRLENTSISTPKSYVFLPLLHLPFAQTSSRNSASKKRSITNPKTPEAKRPKFSEAAILSPISTNASAEASEAEDRVEFN